MQADCYSPHNFCLYFVAQRVMCPELQALQQSPRILSQSLSYSEATENLRSAQKLEETRRTLTYEPMEGMLLLIL